MTSGRGSHQHRATTTVGTTASSTALGPYPDRETAARALQIARGRTEANDRADRQWNNNGDEDD